MLLELVVENYAVVERLRVHFHSGLNLLTGETGSGKSIVVDALGLLLGGRASAEMIRTGESRARVAGIFEVREQPAVRRLLDSAGLEVEDGELLIEREILAGGKSRAFVGSRPVAVALLKDLAPFLGDIHGQHDQQLLFSSEAQREMLDGFAGNRELLDAAARHLSRVAGRGRGVGGVGAQRAGEAAAAGPVELPAEGNRERRAAAGRRRTTGERAAGAAECAEAAGKRGHGLRCGVRESGIGGGAGADCGQTGGGALPDRCVAGRIARAPESGGIELAGSGVRTARLFVGAGGQSGAVGRSGDPAGSNRAAQAEIRPLDRRDPDVSGRSEGTDGGRGVRRRAHGGAAQGAASGWRRNSKSWRAH